MAVCQTVLKQVSLQLIYGERTNGAKDSGKKDISA